MEATFTASRNVAKGLEFHLFFTIGFNSATNTNEGRNIASVEMNALIFH
jgi:hypothetical protein